jgi:hypothetical protein
VTPATIAATLRSYAAAAVEQKFPATGALFDLMASDPRLEADERLRNDFAHRLTELFFRLEPDTAERDLVRSAQSALCESTGPVG